MKRIKWKLISHNKVSLVLFQNHFQILKKKTETSKDEFIKDIESKLSENLKYFYCNKCNTTPLIDFKRGDIENVIFSCKCEGQKNINKTIIELINNYVHFINKKENFSYYCKKCDLNLDSENTKSHENHNLLILSTEQNKINEEVDIIKYALELDNEKFTGKNASFDNLRKFVKILMDHYNYRKY